MGTRAPGSTPRLTTPTTTRMMLKELPSTKRTAGSGSTCGRSSLAPSSTTLLSPMMPLQPRRREKTFGQSPRMQRRKRRLKKMPRLLAMMMKMTKTLMMKNQKTRNKKNQRRKKKNRKEKDTTSCEQVKNCTSACVSVLATADNQKDKV